MRFHQQHEIPNTDLMLPRSLLMPPSSTSMSLDSGTSSDQPKRNNVNPRPPSTHSISKGCTHVQTSIANACNETNHRRNSLALNAGRKWHILDSHCRHPMVGTSVISPADSSRPTSPLDLRGLHAERGSHPIPAKTPTMPKHGAQLANDNGER
jgi:hypothetical protein